MSDRYRNGTKEKHLPCTICGRYASDLHPNGDLAQPPHSRPAQTHSDGSTGPWTCRRCLRMAANLAHTALILDKLFNQTGDPDEKDEGNEREGDREPTLFG